MPNFLTRPEAAGWLTEQGFKTSKNTLQKMATTGGGPIYQLFNSRAIYTPENLLKWAMARLSAPRRSTSDVEGAK